MAKAESGDGGWTNKATHFQRASIARCDWNPEPAVLMACNARVFPCSCSERCTVVQQTYGRTFTQNVICNLSPGILWKESESWFAPCRPPTNKNVLHRERPSTIYAI